MRKSIPGKDRAIRNPKPIVIDDVPMGSIAIMLDNCFKFLFFNLVTTYTEGSPINKLKIAVMLAKIIELVNGNSGDDLMKGEFLNEFNRENRAN